MELCDALAVRPGDVVAITGGGGKTTALYRLGAELAARSLPVLLCGTTRFTPPERGEPPNLTLAGSEADVRAAAGAGPWPVTLAAGWGSKGRLLPLDPASIDALHAAQPALTIVIEADGSAMRPFKAPGAHEPVIPASTTLVVSVAGMDVVGRPLNEANVHRPERVAALTGATPGTVVTVEMVAATLAHPEGGRKGVPDGARWAALLNKADTPTGLAAADRIAALLARIAERTVIAQVKREPPVVRIIPAVR